MDLLLSEPSYPSLKEISACFKRHAGKMKTFGPDLEHRPPADRTSAEKKLGQELVQVREESVCRGKQGEGLGPQMPQISRQLSPWATGTLNL